MVSVLKVGGIQYQIKRGKKDFGMFVPGENRFESFDGNDNYYDSLEDCLRGIFVMYGYDKNVPAEEYEYEFCRWASRLTVKVDYW
jgi:hypothetical protein